MSIPRTSRSKALAFLWTASLAVAPGLVSGQTPPRQQSLDQSDVIKVETNLVQSDVMVFDKKGEFVPGIAADQFLVTVDGQTQPLTFFQQVITGSSAEQRQLAAARKPNGAGTATAVSDPNAVDLGRVVFFFVDDLHLDADGLSRSRKALQKFVNQQMGEEDQVCIVSSSGQIGFLQQLTDNQTVLLTAIGRLKNKRETEAYAGRTRISEFAATQIADYNNKALFAYLLDSVKMEQQMGPGSRHGDHRTAAAAYNALPTLENRVSQVNEMSKRNALNTLDNLRRLIDASASLPGRKLVFFLSGGFPFDSRDALNQDLLKKVTTAAAQSGAVFYSIDMRGNYQDSAIDASTNDLPDYSSRKAGLGITEETVTREVMHQLADDTGGRMIANSNAISEDISDALHETSEYYLLAWTLSPDQVADSRHRVRVSVKNRPELRVRMRNDQVLVRNNVGGKPVEKKPSDKDPKPPDAAKDLLLALGGIFPDREIPVLVSAGYVGGDGKEASLRVSMQLDRNSLTLDPAANGPAPTKLDVVGAAVDDRGVIVSFKQTVNVAATGSLAEEPVIWHQQLKVPPGLYQVRVAVRETTTGRTGSAQQWIEVPAQGDQKLAVSSIFLGERAVEAASNNGNTASAPAPLIVDVDHKFRRASVLRFQTYVYNATRNAGASPDVWLEAKIMKDGRQLQSVAPNRLPAEAAHGTNALPYWAEFSMDQLRAGRYVLQVNATDRATGATATQTIKFAVE